jgi:protocatechuate 3,4-dioxygenase beta subunit
MSWKRQALAAVVQKRYATLVKNLLFIISILSVLAISFPGPSARDACAEPCAPTEEDALGPFYKPNSPIRSSVGKGYVLQGVVRSSRDCAAVPGAVIEFWLAGPNGGYDDAHRARIVAGVSGAFRFESNTPPPYDGRPPHIHLRVTAKGYVTLVTQHYPIAGRNDNLFDVILSPAP